VVVTTKMAVPEGIQQDLVAHYDRTRPYRFSYEAPICRSHYTTPLGPKERRVDFFPSTFVGPVPRGVFPIVPVLHFHLDGNGVLILIH
jgi:hypothetical protein